MLSERYLAAAFAQLRQINERRRLEDRSNHQLDTPLEAGLGFASAIDLEQALALLTGYGSPKGSLRKRINELARAGFALVAAGHQSVQALLKTGCRRLLGDALGPTAPVGAHDLRFVDREVVLP